MWDLSGTNSWELSKLLGTTGGPPESRSRHLGIKRGMHMVGFVRWGRNHPSIKEILSGGVGLVRGMECGIFQFCADVQRAGSGRPSDTDNLWYLETNFGEQDVERGTSDHFDLQVIGKHLDPLHEILHQDPTLAIVGLDPHRVNVQVSEQARDLFEPHLQITLHSWSWYFATAVNFGVTAQVGGVSASERRPIGPSTRDCCLPGNGPIRTPSLEVVNVAGDSAVGRDRIQSAQNLRRVHAESAQ